MGKLGDVLAHPEEILPLARIAWASKQATKLPKDPNLAFCYDMLNTVSRSFAVVIQQLPVDLRDAICVFYLVLRGLDTVEDDMAIAPTAKIPQLLSFHEKIYERGFAMDVGYGHYVRLMRQFDTVVEVFLGLDPTFQSVIADITARMGAGMAQYIALDVETVDDYDEYCHYVAGLVGVGLSKLFAASHLEERFFAGAKAEELSNHMGLFLQKTNIIRDYLEDINEEPAPRMFWPRAIWGRFASRLEEFREPAARPAAVRCLNALVADALRHVPHCMAYMDRLRNPDIFRFCAIPQVMAVGTLALCYNNGRVFEGVVKMRRGLTARVFDEVASMADLQRWFLRFLGELQVKAASEVDPTDPSLPDMRRALGEAVATCQRLLDEALASAPPPSFAPGKQLTDLTALLAVGAWFYSAWGMGRDGSEAAAGGLGQLLPEGYRGVERALAMVLLLAMLSRVVLARV